MGVAGAGSKFRPHVMGAILNKYGTLDYEVGALGFPIGNESPIANNGRFNSFDNGSIYWSSPTGAHTVWGEIGRYWGENGWEGGTYGYPTSDEYSYNGLPRQNFQNGSVTYAPVTIPITPEDAVPGTPALPEDTVLRQSPGDATDESPAPETAAPSPSEPAPSTETSGESAAQTSTLPTATSSDAAAETETTQPSVETTEPIDEVPNEVVIPNTAGQLPPREGELGREPIEPGMSPQEMQRILGGFCIFGTNGGPGGACRGGGTIEAMTCVAAMVVAIGSLYFPYAKVLKLKRMLNDNGGARTVAVAFGALNSEEKKNYAAETLELGCCLQVNSSVSRR